MRGAVPWTGVLAATAVLLCTAGALSPGVRAQAVAEEGGASDSAAVRSLWSTLDAMWNARDAERFSDLFTVDTSFEFVDRRQSLEGRATIRQQFAERFPRFAPDLRHLTSVHRIRTVAPDVLAVDGEVEILSHGSEESAKPTILRTFAIFAVMLRTTDGWRIHALRVYELPAESGNASR